MKSSRTALPWLLWASYAVATGVFLRLGALNGEGDLVEGFPILFAFTAFMTVGTVIVARYRRHAIGWAFVTVGLGTALANLAQQYAVYALVTRPGSLPGGVAVAWVGNWLWPVSMSVIAFLPLLFPDGRPPSARWRPVLWVGGAGFAAMTLAMLVKPGPLDVGRKENPIMNPLGIARVPGLFDVLEGGWLLLLAVLIAGVIGLIVRARRSASVERQQLKWFGFAATFMLVGIAVVGPLAEVLFEGELRFQVGNAFFGVGVAALPTATGIAILRYRLYDIDVIINRTLVYGALTAILAAAYAAIVTVAGTILQASDIVTAGATLAVAALFQPLRRRIQGFIDRRFYRRKYDAARTVEAFSSRLRDEVDLDAMQAQLLGVVQETMQPRWVSIWLRG